MLSGLGLRPNFSFKGFRLGWVLSKPKLKKRCEATGQGIPLELGVGFESSVGFRSSSGLQRLKVTAAVDMGGGLSDPSSFEVSLGAEELSLPLEGADSCLITSLAADLYASEGAALSFLLLAGSGPISFVPESSLCASFLV